MAKVSLLQSRYGQAVQDLPRHLGPQGAVWQYTDCFPNLGAPVRKRGGRVAVSPTIASGAILNTLAWAPFAAGSQLIVVDWNPGTPVAYLIDPDAVTKTALTGSPGLSYHPTFFEDLLILPNFEGASGPKKYSGSGSFANLGGSPPSGTYATTHKSRLVLAASAALPNTVWFSAVADPETWDADAFITTTYPIRGIASLGSSILVFSQSHVEIIRGSTPPNSAGTTGDMTLDPLFEVGTSSARTIFVHEARAVWASETGIYVTDGAALDDLTKLGGFNQKWTGQFLTSGVASGIAGFLNGWYFINIASSFYAVNLETKVWGQFSHLPADARAFAAGDRNELYTSWQTKVEKYSGLFAPASANNTDVTSGGPNLVLETEFFRGNPGSRRWKNLYIGVDLDASAGTYLKVSYVTSPEATSYTDIVDDAGAVIQIPPTTGYQRVKIPFGVAAPGIGLKITQVGAANDLKIYDIEADVIEREASR